MNIVDLVIIVLIALGAVTGYRRGLIESLAGLFSNIIGFFAALKYYSSLVLWASTYFNLKMSLQTYFQTHLVLPVPLMQLKLDKVPLSEIGNYLDKIKLPIVLKAQLIEYIQSLEAGMLTQAKLGDVIFQYLATAIINAGAFILIWFLVNILIMLIVGVVRSITNNTVIGSVDHGAGLLIGMVLTGFTLTIIIGLLSPLLQVTNLAEPTLFSAVFKTMGESELLPYFLNTFNLLTNKIAAFWL